MEMLNWLCEEFLNSKYHFQSKAAREMTQATHKENENIIEAIGLDAYNKIEDYISGCEKAAERAGFIEGFNLATRLLLR